MCWCGCLRLWSHMGACLYCGHATSAHSGPGPRDRNADSNRARGPRRTTAGTRAPDQRGRCRGPLRSACARDYGSGGRAVIAYQLSCGDWRSIPESHDVGAILPCVACNRLQVIVIGFAASAEWAPRTTDQKAGP